MRLLALTVEGVRLCVIHARTWSARLLLMAPAAALCQGGMLRPDQTPDSAILAAQVELFVLRASVPLSGARKKDLVAIAPATKPVAADQAAEILARMPKPIRCTADVTEIDVLSVECVQLTSAEEDKLHAIYVTVMEEQLLSARGPSKSAALHNRVVVRSAGRPGEELLVPENVFVRWCHDYQLPPSITFGVWPATSARGAEQGDPIYEVHRIEPVNPESVPPEIRPLFR